MNNLSDQIKGILKPVPESLHYGENAFVKGKGR